MTKIATVTIKARGQLTFLITLDLARDETYFKQTRSLLAGSVCLN